MSSHDPLHPATVVAVIAGLLVLLLAVPVHGNAAWLGVLQDAAHGPVFATIAIALTLTADPVGSAASRGVPAVLSTRTALRVFVATQALGLAVELAQDALGRPASRFDLGSNAAGATVGLALVALVRHLRRASPRTRPGPAAWILAGACVLALGYLAWRPVEAALAYLHRAREFPVLASFAAPRDLYFVRVRGASSEIVALPGPWAGAPAERALRVRYDASRAPAVQLVEPWRDWRGYQVLAVDLTNPAPHELGLVLRVLDAEHDWTAADRLNLPFAVPARSRITVRVPLDAVRSAPARRPMDLARIANVMVFGAPSRAGELYVSGFRLE